MNKYLDAENLLSSQGRFYINPGLERVSKILDIFGNPQDKLKCIHVAGTNGKGSVCAIIDAILRKSGIKTGLYTSPHIFEYTERIKVDGQKISRQEFTNLVFAICDIADKNNIPLTEFEILTVAAFKYFKEQNCEIVVLETGLGGRLDATNVIKSNLCAIITHIDFDHVEFLGNTKDKIAFEKAGIIKENCPVFTSEGYEVIRDTAFEKNSLLVMTTPCADTSKLTLKGTCQSENLPLALAAVRYLFPNIGQTVIDEGLHSVVHPARFQYIKSENLIIDAAHNPNGILALRNSLDTYYPNMNRRFVFGCLKNKNYKEMMNILFSKEDEIYFYHFNNKKSCTLEELKNACKYPSEEFISLNALNAKKTKHSVLTIICGSFYMLNEIISENLLLSPALNSQLSPV